MRLVRIAALGAVAAAVVMQHASSPAPVPGALTATSTVHERPAAWAAPAQVSFDDLTPAQTGLDQPGDASVRPGAARPPLATSAATGSSPKAGTAQAVLAAAYRSAVAKAPPGCHLSVTHLAAIGQVESGSVGGRSVTAGHVVTPAIYGPLLDGGPFAVIRDTDRGVYDGDSSYDRAMGPLQFVPGTWSSSGRDGDGDGRRDPQNVYDAALATAHYLCEGRDLSSPGDLRSAILSYNQSDEYLASVLQWVSFFGAHGLAALNDVAFRVGSGGRASDFPAIVDPTAEPTASPTSKPTTAQAAARPSKAKSGPAPSRTTPVPSKTTPPPVPAVTPASPAPTPTAAPPTTQGVVPSAPTPASP